MTKIFPSLLFFLLLITVCQKAEGQTSKKDLPNKKSKIAESNDSQFYSGKFLKSDLNQVAAVVYVNVLSRELADKLGEGDCEEGKGAGYCLYRLKAEVKEVFKGKIETKVFEFYTVTDLDYANKDLLLGEKVVFLNQSDNYPDKKMSFGTLENSTRSIKYNVLAKLRKVSK